MHYRVSGNDPSALPHQESDAATLNMLERNLRNAHEEATLGTKIDEDLVRDLVDRIGRLRRGESKISYDALMGPEGLPVAVRICMPLSNEDRDSMLFTTKLELEKVYRVLGTKCVNDPSKVQFVEAIQASFRDALTTLETVWNRPLERKRRFRTLTKLNI
jgi:hypothetical protein